MGRMRSVPGRLPAVTPSPACPVVDANDPAGVQVRGSFEVPKETVYQWRKKHTGPPGFRIGKHLRYDPADVLAHVAERKSTGQDAA